MSPDPARPPEPCPRCGGDGREIVGEHRVTRDMAIDAGDRSMEGAFYGYVTEPCDACGGSGVIEPVQPPAAEADALARLRQRAAYLMNVQNLHVAAWTEDEQIEAASVIRELEAELARVTAVLKAIEALPEIAIRSEAPLSARVIAAFHAFESRLAEMTAERDAMQRRAEAAEDDWQVAERGATLAARALQTYGQHTPECAIVNYRKTPTDVVVCTCGFGDRQE